MKQFYHLPQSPILDWEARMDCHGRIFYIDHKNHKTTWQRPSIESYSDSKTKNAAEQEGQSIDQDNSTVAKRLSVYNYVKIIIR